jgi:CheY-like chemotaxis protein
MNRFRKTKLKQESQPHTEILRISEKKFFRTRRTPASAPIGILSLDRTVALRHKQARRPPAVAGSKRPVILLAENRESTRVALKKVLEATGYEVIDVERATEALSIAVGYDERIDFLITDVVFPGINGGMLAHLFQCLHPETRALFLSGSSEEVLICHGALDQKIAVLEQPVRLDVFASKVREILETRLIR